MKIYFKNEAATCKSFVAKGIKSMALDIIKALSLDFGC
jgi:hypothetical protein